MPRETRQQGDPARETYERARDAMESGQLEEACALFAASASLEPHFKALELLGECHLLLGRSRDAVVPLAAATSLNAQSRAPMLLAEAFHVLGDAERATEFARLALERSPENKRARVVLEAAGSQRAE